MNRDEPDHSVAFIVVIVIVALVLLAMINADFNDPPAPGPNGTLEPIGAQHPHAASAPDARASAHAK